MLSLHLAKERELSEQAASSLSMLKKRWRYDGRRVTDFRVFDPAATKAAGITPLSFRDLDACSVLFSGHVEKDGRIVLRR